MSLLANAPEYEGMDKGLAIAKIGFAMGMGQSPNAITNIANAYLKEPICF